MASTYTLALRAILAALSNDPEITAIIPAENIVPGERDLPAVYPCVTIDMEAATGETFAESIEGSFELRVYWQGAKPLTQLSAVQDAAKLMLNRKGDDFSTVDVSINLCEEINRTGMMTEIDVPKATKYMVARYRIMATTK